MERKVVTIVGVGLIGGSLALQLNEKGLASRIIGVEQSETHAVKALELGLVDQIGPLDDAVRRVRDLAQLGPTCRVVEYEKPRAPAEWALGVQAPWGLSHVGLADALAPRVWALAPGMEAATLLTLPGRE